MGAPRVASVLDVSLPRDLQRPKSVATPVNRPVQITVEQVSDPQILAKQLTSMNLALQQTSQAQRSHPEQAPTTFKNVVCGAGGATVTLAHGFGIFADYVVTKWKGSATVAGHSLVCDEDDATPGTNKDTLVLRSYVTGIANIRVFPGV